MKMKGEVVSDGKNNMYKDPVAGKSLVSGRNRHKSSATEGE